MTTASTLRLARSGQTIKAGRAFLLAFFIALGGLPLYPAPAVQAQIQSQSQNQSQSIPGRLNQMQTDINYLGQLIGELQRAVRAERGARDGLANVQGRLGALENEIRTLTASIEQLQFSISQDQQRAEQERAQLAFRLERLEAQKLGATVSASEPDFQIVRPSAERLPVTTAPAARRPIVDGFDPYRAAGLIEESEIEERSDAVAGQYRAAYQLYQQARYPEAEAALRSFIESNGDDPLIANASYWLGETFYARGDYQQAALQFAQGYRRHGESTKGGDHLLKLSLSLAELGRRDEACGSLALLSTKYALTQPEVAAQGRDQARAIGCAS